jgi:hypothetical protein
MFSRLLGAFGVKKPSGEQEIIRIGAELMAADFDDIVVRAVEENDRAAHLDVIKTLLYGAPGVTRNPADALLWARAALERGRKIQIAEYAEKLIPEAIAGDALLVKKGHARLLERANRSDAAAQCEIGTLLLAQARKANRQIFFKLRQGKFYFEGPGALLYQRALDWYAMAKEAGDVTAGDTSTAIYAEMINRGKPADDTHSRSRPQEKAPNAAPAERAAPRREPRREPVPAPGTVRAPGSSSPDYLARRASGAYTVRVHFSGGYVDVLGGKLPKSSQIGADVEIRYDGQWPRYIGKNGNRERYSTDGNLQVFYKTPAATNKYVWIAKFVDSYNLF